jgi:hypothetical protein
MCIAVVDRAPRAPSRERPSELGHIESEGESTLESKFLRGFEMVTEGARLGRKETRLLWNHRGIPQPMRLSFNGGRYNCP